jgi:hypothetical protein
MARGIQTSFFPLVLPLAIQELHCLEMAKFLSLDLDCYKRAEESLSQGAEGID